jgi:tRNA(fMet)-specific endonuclease VapC
MKYLLDTSICVFFLRGELNLDDISKEKGRENCFISEITVIKLKYIAENSKSPSKSHMAVDSFVNGIPIIPIVGSIELYAKEKVRLKCIGTPMHDDFNLLIRVNAIANQLILVTDNIKD